MNYFWNTLLFSTFSISACGGPWRWCKWPQNMQERNKPVFLCVACALVGVMTEWFNTQMCSKFAYKTHGDEPLPSQLPATCTQHSRIAGQRTLAQCQHNKRLISSSSSSSSFGATAPVGQHPLIHEVSKSHTHTTDSRTSLDEWSAHRRDLYLTTPNTHNSHPCPRCDSNP
jgi:hypothetical protein